MPNKNQPRVAIIGVGNILRGDDAAGIYVSEQIEALALPGVKTYSVHQLDTSLLEELRSYDHILVVDASISDTRVHIYPAASQSATITSHHLNAAVLTNLAQTLYAHTLPLFICALPTTSFELGAPLTETARTSISEAVSFISKWIQSPG